MVRRRIIESTALVLLREQGYNIIAKCSKVSQVPILPPESDIHCPHV
jgi:hypothetical protein